ncbi:MAG: hypothetical protein U0401_07905 [Anaerolineae bacterium]
MIPGIITLMLNAQITGSLFLPYFFSEGYNYPGGEFAPTVGGQSASDNLVAYIFRSTVGDHGLLVYCPLLIFSLIGLIQRGASQILGRGRPCVCPAAGATLAVAPTLISVGIVGHLVFIWLRTNNFGGDAYGLCYFIPSLPVLFFFTTFLKPISFYKPLSDKIGAALWFSAACISIFRPIRELSTPGIRLHRLFL